MDIRPIRTDADHRAALKEIEALWGAEERTPEGDRLDVMPIEHARYQTFIASCFRSLLARLARLRGPVEYVFEGVWESTQG